MGNSKETQIKSFKPLEYVKETFTIGSHSTELGSIAKVSSEMTARDRWGGLLARCGINRNRYSIKPGIYSIGNPDKQSPVLVTANYKLSFDHLRRSIPGIDAWILVLDTKGINVWCAAGKGTFGTEELLSRMNEVGLSELVSHRKIILPQLSANGVAAHIIKKRSGFKVIWGPVQADRLLEFLKLGMKADETMRRIEFPLLERIVLTPVEIRMLLKPAVVIFAILFLLSGIGSSGFSIPSAIERGSQVILAGLVGIVTGTIVVPILLPWIPGRSFYLKGLISGLLGSVVLINVFITPGKISELLAVSLFTLALSSYLAMNFTGSTPYTSPSGVEKEMRIGIPVQIAMILVALILWFTAPFT